jgi:hypothetical protein
VALSSTRAFGRTTCRSGRAVAGVGLGRVERDDFEAMPKWRQSGELLDLGQRMRRFAPQHVIRKQQQPVRFGSVHRLRQRVPREARHAARPHQPLGARIHSAARIEVEEFRQLPAVVPQRPFGAVQNPGNLPDAADDFRIRKRRRDEMQPVVQPRLVSNVRWMPK